MVLLIGSFSDVCFRLAGIEFHYANVGIKRSTGMCYERKDLIFGSVVLII